MSQILISNDFWKMRNENVRLPVYWRESEVSNHHVGVAGTSGAGKTHWIRQFVTGMPDDVEIDIFDYHGDIDIAGAKTVLFSEATRYGYNPLILNTDPHYGGVRRSVNDVVEAINSTSRQLGGNQEGVLRHLLTDSYMMKGIFADNPRTWSKREASEAEIRELMEARNWSGLREVYPTLGDVINFAKRKLKALWMGIEDKDGGRQALSAFDEYCRAMGAVNQLRMKLNKSGAKSNEDLDRLQKRMETAKAKAFETHATFLNSLENGREFEEAMKYNSKDVLLSVITRLENLNSTGIFNPNPPPFGNARIRRYILKPLAHFSSDFIKNAGTLLLLNLATADWGEAARKLKIEVKDLKYLRPQETGAVRMLEKGQSAAFRQVRFGLGGRGT